MSYSSVILATAGLQSYWRLGDASGNVTDEVGGITGTVDNTPTYGVTGALTSDTNKAMSFVRTSSQRVKFGNNYEFAGTASFSLELWIKLAAYDGSFNYIVSMERENPGGNGWAFNWNPAGFFNFFRSDNTTGQGVDGPSSPGLNVWIHYVATYDGTDLKLYQNGNLVANTPSFVSLPTKTNPELTFAAVFTNAGGYTNHATCSLDEVSIYNVPLSSTTISQHYLASSLPDLSDKLKLKDILSKTWGYGRNLTDKIKLKEQFKISIINISTSDIIKIKETFLLTKNQYIRSTEDKVKIKDVFSMLSTAIPRNASEKIKIKDLSSSVHTNIYADDITELDIYSWDTTAISPSGARHVPSGAVAFEDVVSETGYLDFGDIEYGAILTPTKCITIKPSVRTPRSSITNLRLWQSAISGAIAYSTNFVRKSSWVQNYIAQSGAGILLPTSLPLHQNILRWDGSEYIDNGTVDPRDVPETDQNTSEYCYLSANLPPLSRGYYGAVGTGSLQLKISYDYTIGVLNE